MLALWSFVVGLWNAAVSAFPLVAHTVCEIVNTGAQAAKLGGGS